MEAEVRELVARYRIRDCIDRYARGLDRMDREMMLSAFHDGAESDHGLFCGSSVQMCDIGMDSHARRQSSHNTIMANHIARINGETAEAETYWFMIARNVMPPHRTWTGGRFLDRFECRSGRWGIVHRTCLVEWRGAMDDMSEPEIDTLLARAGTPARDRSDPSYDRVPSIAQVPGLAD